MLPDIYNILKDDSAVNDIISGRVFRHGDAPQGVQKPYVTWFLVDGLPENQLSDVPDIDKLIIHIDSWTEDDAGVVTLAKAIRNALEPLAHMTGMPVNERDDKTRLYRIGLQFDWFLNRS